MNEGLLIRADADQRIGVGHVMRCLALAQAWRDAGRGPVWLVSSDLPASVHERYEHEGAHVCLAAPGPEGLSSALRNSGAAWVVLDGYQFGVREQRAAADGRSRLLVVDDDGAMGEYECDLIVDANLFAADGPYAMRRATTRLLLGPRYALLRREIRRLGAPRQLARGRPRVLVSFGGSDPAGLSAIATDALGGIDADVVVVLGPANVRRDCVERAAARVSNTQVMTDVTNMRELMDAADIALVAAGSTCLELAHAGVPQVVVAVADNQRRVAQALAERGVARFLGDAASVGAQHIRDAVVALVADRTTQREMRERGRSLVDGGGAQRVVDAMVCAAP